LKSIEGEKTFAALNKLAIDFSDGVIQGSETINPEILDYIKSKNEIPFLPYQSPETYIDETNRFYDVVFGNNQ
ncbi:MAG: glycogen/starch synthase, partial [Tannerellaceae bacterium]